MNALAGRLVFTAIIVAAGVAVPLAIQQHGQTNLRQQTEALRLQAARFADCSAENQRLSNLVAQLAATPLSKEELTELLRLRGQLAPLRRAAAEADRFRANLTPQR